MDDPRGQKKMATADFYALDMVIQEPCFSHKIHVYTKSVPINYTFPLLLYYHLVVSIKKSKLGFESVGEDK